MKSVCGRGAKLEDEAARARALIEQLGLPAEPVAELRWQLEGDAALELVHRARALASAPEPELVVEWPASAPWETRNASPGHLRVRVERLGEWFGIGGSIEVDGAEIRENSARTYLRAFDCLVNFARTRRGRRPLDAWCDECVVAIESGQLEAPQSLPPFLRTAVRRAAALGDERSGRSSPARR